MSRIITSQPTLNISPELAINQSNWDHPEHLAIGQLTMEQLFKTVSVDRGCNTMPLPQADQHWPLDDEIFSDILRPERTITAEQFLNRRLFNDALLIVHRGKVVHESYRNGMSAQDRHVIHSCTKSLISILVRQAVERRLLDPSAEIGAYVPELAALDAWGSVTLQQVWNMQAGINYSEDYTDPGAHYWSYARSAGYYPPLAGESVLGVKKWIFNNLTERSQRPGEEFLYNSCLTNVLGMALESVYRQPLVEIFEQQFYRHVGAEMDGYFNTDHLGFPIAEGQLSLSLRDFARCAWALANEGRSLTGEHLFSPEFPAMLATPSVEAQKIYQRLQPDKVFPQGQYSHQYWGVDTVQRQFSMLGIHGQFAWFDLDNDVFAVGVGSFPQQDGELMMLCLKELWQRISAQAKIQR